MKVPAFREGECTGTASGVMWLPHLGTMVPSTRSGCRVEGVTT